MANWWEWLTGEAEATMAERLNRDRYNLLNSQETNARQRIRDMEKEFSEKHDRDRERVAREKLVDIERIQKDRDNAIQKIHDIDRQEKGRLEQEKGEAMEVAKEELEECLKRLESVYMEVDEIWNNKLAEAKKKTERSAEEVEKDRERNLKTSMSGRAENEEYRQKNAEKLQKEDKEYTKAQQGLQRDNRETQFKVHQSVALQKEKDHRLTIEEVHKEQKSVLAYLENMFENIKASISRDFIVDLANKIVTFKQEAETAQTAVWNCEAYWDEGIDMNDLGNRTNAQKELENAIYHLEKLDGHKIPLVKKIAEISKREDKRELENLFGQIGGHVTEVRRNLTKLKGVFLRKPISWDKEQTRAISKQLEVIFKEIDSIKFASSGHSELQNSINEQVKPVYNLNQLGNSERT